MPVNGNEFEPRLPGDPPSTTVPEGAVPPDIAAMKAANAGVQLAEFGSRYFALLPY